MRRPDHHPGRWMFMVLACAQRAYSDHRDMPRGVALAEDDDVLVFFDNAPLRGSMLVRERAVARFGAHLADAGIHMLATATYPQSGPDDGLCLAVVLDAGAHDAEAVTAAWGLTCREQPLA